MNNFLSLIVAATLACLFFVAGVAAHDAYYVSQFSGSMVP
jgi:hypothetical protein